MKTLVTRHNPHVLAKYAAHVASASYGAEMDSVRPVAGIEAQPRHYIRRAENRPALPFLNGLNPILIHPSHAHVLDGD